MGIKVMATRLGQYGETASEARLYSEGEVFEVSSEAKLGSWMERLDGKKNPAQERVEKAQQSLEKNGYAPIKAELVRATPAPSKGDKLAAARKAKELKKAAEKKAKQEAEDKELAKNLV